MIKAILFDFNGVIINDEPIQFAAYRDRLRSGEDIELTEAEYYSCLGMDDRTFVAAALERAGRPVDPEKILEITAAKTELWREAITKEPPIFPGVENFIRKMGEEMTLGIVSMARRAEIEYFLEIAGLANEFSIIVSADDITRCKPDPQCYRDGFRRIDEFRIAAGHAPLIHDECLVIEDTPPGVRAAKAADLRVLGVTNTVAADELRAAGADWIAKQLDDWFPESVRRVFA